MKDSTLHSIAKMPYIFAKYWMATPTANMASETIRPNEQSFKTLGLALLYVETIVTFAFRVSNHIVSLAVRDIVDRSKSSNSCLVISPFGSTISAIRPKSSR